MAHPKILRLIAVLMAFGLLAAACGDDDDGGGEGASASCDVDQIDGDLAMFNWSEYIDREQLDAFEAEYDVSVTMDTFDSNEAMQPIVAAGNSGYDMVVPSDYFVSVLVSGGTIQALDQDAIPNKSNLGSDFTDPSYDPGNVYSMPYQWGTTGLGVNTAVVGTDFDRSWSLIFDPEIAAQNSGRITLLNDPRETMGAALVYLGYSLNSTSEEELAEATALVSEAKANLAAFDTDQARTLLVEGQIDIAHGYSGDMFVEFLDAENPDDFVYFVPKEGGAKWVDTMAILSDAPHPCTAHTFINWLLGAEQGAALSNWNYYGTPNDAAIDGLDEELNVFLTDPSVIVSGVESLEQYVDTGDFEINYTDAFIEAKG